MRNQSEPKELWEYLFMKNTQVKVIKRGITRKWNKWTRRQWKIKQVWETCEIVIHAKRSSNEHEETSKPEDIEKSNSSERTVREELLMKKILVQ